VDSVKGRVMGIDYGEKRVGVAVSDPLRILARGVGTLDNTTGLFDLLSGIVADEQVVLVVVGMPYAPDGGRGKKGREVERFIVTLRSALRIPVESWDESYTSVNAHRAFLDAGMKRKKRRQKARVDEMAARLLLEDYLENSSHQRS
jgi:putative Holliday junction resolvase